VALLIDGYNLLHASGILGRGRGPGSLERSRTALLNFLVQALEPAELARTTVVFDAGISGRGLPRSHDHQGIVVHFSSGHADADELIEQLIRRDSTPRRLTVVSSDHRLQRAARRRRAHAVDSDKWFAAMVRARSKKNSAMPPAVKPAAPLDEHQIRFWLRQFGAEDEAAAEEPADSAADMKREDAVADDETAPDNPFPPGYAEDIDEEDC
jgi:predicted RNA-binding protein with PIN domain